MSDLISRQDAINLIQDDKIKLVEPYISVFKSTGCIKEAETQAMTCDRHIDMLRKMPSVNVVTTCYDSNLWIPSSEGPPKDDDWKIVTIKDESGDSPYLYTDFGWYLDVAKCWIIDAEQRTDVIAWMNLPNPYATNKRVCATDAVEQKMGDYINKQDVLDAFRKELSSEYNGREWAITMTALSFSGIESILNEIKSADVVERKRGEWKPHPTEREWDFCSNCGVGVHRREYGYNEDGTEWVEEVSYIFCPWCGAEMLSEKKEA